MRRQTHGTLLQLSDGAASNPVYTTVAHVLRVKPPGIERGVTELADHDMLQTKMYLPNGLGGLPAVGGRIYLDPQHATHIELEALSRSASIEDWRILLPNAAGQWDFEGFLTAFDPDDVDADDGVLEADFAIQPTDTPVMT